MGRVDATRLLVLAAVAAVAVTGCTRPGTYEPATPLAGEMSQEWREFAYRVDVACATNFNAGQAELATLEGREDLSGPGWEAAYRFIQARHQQRTHDEIAALGRPPARPRLFRAWLDNVGRRAQMMRDLAAAWRSRDARLQSVHSLRIDAAKIEADWLALHFGLRICPSNGPMQNRDPGVDYMDELKGVCAKYMRRNHQLWRQGRFTPNAAAGNSLAETLELAAIAPPIEQFRLRARILRIKRGIDRVHVGAIERAARSSDPDAWVKVGRETDVRITRGRNRLARMGLTSCAWRQR